MPIRFRCRHCNQLMGIARRKAGTMVHCPTCHAEVLVPLQEGEEVPPAPRPAPPPAAPAPAPLFERSEFEAFLHNPVTEGPPPRPAEPPPPLAFDVPLAPVPPVSPVVPPPPSQPSLPSLAPGALPAPAAGVFLSPAQATWLTVVVILLVALAFGAGLLVGHYWMG